MKFFIIIFLLLNSNAILSGQAISGTVFEMNSEMTIEYVNIGIVGKNVGTVSDQNGRYRLLINPEYHNDTLRFSSIGYHSYSVKVSDFVSMNNGNVSLEKREYELTEMVVRPRRFRERTLGVTTRVSLVHGCFMDSITGSEIGMLMKNEKIAFLKEVNLVVSNVLPCSFDSIFYRINIYKADNNMQFENILTNPVYVSASKREARNNITVDLRRLNLVIDGDFLVTFEGVKDLGVGRLCFPASIFHKTYQRKASQGAWEILPVGISMSAVVDVER